VGSIEATFAAGEVRMLNETLGYAQFQTKETAVIACEESSVRIMGYTEW
jgi:hypothetical protein